MVHYQGIFRNRSVWFFAKLILVTVLLGSLFMGFYILPARATTTTVYASADNALITNSLDSSVGDTVYSNNDLGVGFNWEVWPLTGQSYIGWGSAIKFNVDALIGGKTIIKATLKLWPYLLPTDWDTQYAVNAIAGYWNPATITWNSPTSYFLGGEARVNPPVTTAIPMEFDVTTIVQNWADGSWTNYGFMLRDTTLWHPGYNAWRATGIESLEYYFYSDHRPQLYLEYADEPSKVATPTFSPPGGTYDSAQSVEIACDTPGSSIRYTTDGSTPTSSHGTIYSGQFTVPSSITLKAIAYKAGYTDSNVATATYTINIPSDNTPPTGSIVINGGNQGTTSTSVTLTLTYADDSSGVKDVCYANSGDATWSDWEPPSPIRSWTLRSGEEWKTVMYQVRDNADNTATFYAYIALDFTGPGTPVPDDGVSGWSTDNTPTFTWSPVSDALSGVASYGCWVDIGSPTWTTGTSITLPAQPDGSHTFYVSAHDNAGNPSYAGSHAFQIDTAAPTGSIVINGGATSTSSTSVTLALTYADATSGVDKVRYTNANEWSNEPWENPATSKSWTLTSGEGTKYVSYQVRDKAGLISDTFWDSISYAPEKVATPTFSPPGGTYTSVQNVVVNCGTAGATIRYTTNGVDPTSTTGTVIASGGSVSVGSSLTLKAKAFKSGMTDSDTATAAYTINIPLEKVATPTLSPSGGTYTSAQNVALSCVTDGATIRYTVDGSEPSSSSVIYSTPISVSSGTVTIKAKAFKSGLTDSDTASATFTLVEGQGPFYCNFNVSFEEDVFVVGTCSNSSVSDLNFNQALKRLRFSVDGEEGSVGFCNITVPASLMSGNFSLYVDDTALVEGVDYTQSYNGTHYLFRVNYVHSSHIIEVFSTEVVPDFAAWLFLPFLISATLVGVALRKRWKS
jgi:hypothetical protein